MVVGLGSILGTGVFAIVALGATIAGPAVLPAIGLAAALAVCNGFNSAQLAARYPVSGGTYEYGHRLLNADLGFTAGWMFLLAKSASAATAALAIGHYIKTLSNGLIHPLLMATGIVVLVVLIVLRGIRRTQPVNATIVSITLLSLCALVLIGLIVWASGHHPAWPETFWVAGTGHNHALPAFLEACALIFVAYTGYGRIATMGEEIHHPTRNIPKAIKITLLVSALLYLGVALVYLAFAGTGGPFELNQIAEKIGYPGLPFLLTIGALTAMAGVLLNLVLGLSRMLLAMGRRGEMPDVFAHLKHDQPRAAILGVGALILLLSLLGDIKTAWSFSAFTVLLYYAICNACALRLPREDRMFSRAYGWGGLAGCLFLAFWVEWEIGAAGLALVVAGLLWRRLRARYASK